MQGHFYISPTTAILISYDLKDGLCHKKAIFDDNSELYHQLIRFIYLNWNHFLPVACAKLAHSILATQNIKEFEALPPFVSAVSCSFFER